MIKRSTKLLFFNLIFFGLSIRADDNKLPDPLVWVDFDAAMCTNNYRQAIELTDQIVTINGWKLYDFFKELYNKNFTARLVPDQKPRIPKIIHQMWLGSPMPEELKRFTQTWFAYHAGWSYILWTEEEMKKFPLYNQDIYDDSTNYGVKTDIASYEILYHMGGVYLDTDMRCIQSLDILHHTFDFYVGIQPLDSFFLQLGHGIIGSIPGHPILKHCIETMRENYHRSKGAPTKTGPVHFTRSFFLMAGKDENLRDIAFPVNYFYPLGSQEPLAGDDDELVAKWRKQEAFGVHYWAKTWMPREYRRGEFRKIDNQESTKDWNK